MGGPRPIIRPCFPSVCMGGARTSRIVQSVLEIASNGIRQTKCTGELDRLAFEAKR